MESLMFAGAVLIADVLMLTTFVMAVSMGIVSRRTRAGRITFGSISTLKLWIVLFLTYVVMNMFVPEVFRPYRVPIRWFFALYLVVQSIVVMIALQSWRRNPIG